MYLAADPRNPLKSRNIYPRNDEAGDLCFSKNARARPKAALLSPEKRVHRRPAAVAHRAYRTNGCRKIRSTKGCRSVGALVARVPCYEARHAFEALDRLSRDMEDLAGIHKRLSFLGIEIRAVHEGVVNTVLVGLRGLVGQLYREDNAHKVRRGLSGRVGQGLNAGGRAYGYAPIAGDKGKRTIVEAEAQIIGRIFEEYVGGRTPREIARDLNHEGIAPPRGRSWNASTINANMQRGTDLIQNELYAGRLVWNKVSMVKDPDTGKRLSRPNDKKDWQIADVPDLRIVSQELFNAAQSRKQARGHTHPNKQRRPRHMLSGMLRCGACGAGMSTNGKDKSGRIRIRCSTATESGTCGDAKTFYLQTVESAVLAGLEGEMRHPSVIAEYVRTYLEERKRLSAKANAKRAHLERDSGNSIARSIDLSTR
jgi:site-specific DNA recombinase